MKRHVLLALLSGILLVASWPTYGLSPLIFIAFIPLLWSEYDLKKTEGVARSGRKIFSLALLSFLIWNSGTSWWIWYASPFGMFFAIVVNSLLMAFVFWMYHVTAKRLPNRFHLLLLPAFWISFEKMHLHWDFSWPWLNLGNVFATHPEWIQWYEYTGSFGGSLWVWAVNLWLLYLLKRTHPSRLTLPPFRSLIPVILLVVFPLIFSVVQYRTFSSEGSSAEVVVLQPNIDPYTEKYDRDNSQFARELIALSEDYVDADTELLIAPETYLSQNSDIARFQKSEERDLLTAYLSKHPNLRLLTGVDVYRLYVQSDKPTPTANKLQRGGWYDVYNAAVEIENGASDEWYIKSKLVVGVEHFPFKNILEPLLGNIMLDLGGTIASRATQEERMAYSSEKNNIRVAPIICYESVYGEFVTDYIDKEANLLAIMTNDAWWNNTEGHRQHLNYARIRAIETRRDIARSANTGISALINARGDLLQTLPYNQKGALKGKLILRETKTFYTIAGDFIARLAILISGILLLYSVARKKA